MKNKEVNLEDLLGGPSEDMERVLEQEGMETFGEVSLSEDQSYIQFRTAEFIKFLKPFLEKKKAGRDIVTRSMLMVPHAESVELFSTDGIAHLQAEIPAKVNKFDKLDKPVVFDIKSVHAVSRAGTKHTFFLMERGHLYIDFFGGRIFIPTFSLPEKRFKSGLKPLSTKLEVDGPSYAAALKALYKVIETTDVPDLCYLFLGPDGAYASNGAVVARVDGSFPEHTLRQRDAILLSMIVEEFGKASTAFGFHKEMAEVSTSKVSYTFPVVDRRLPDSHKQRPERVENIFHIIVPFARKICTIFSNMPDSSGILILDFQKTCLQGEVRTRKGNISTFKLSESQTGCPTEGKVQVAVKTFQTALGVFAEDSNIAIGRKGDGSLLMFSDDKVLSFMAKPLR